MNVNKCLSCTLIILCVASLGQSALIASSELTACIDEGADGLECEEKIVITLSIEAGQGETEAVEAIVYSATDSQGVTQQLERPFRVSVSKSVPKLLYPIVYLQNVNARPFEEVIYGGVLFDVCDDGSESQHPTCGWYQESGFAVPYSQGFCCSCDWSDFVLDDTDATRGDLTCSILDDSGSSAHCLRFDELWYSAFSIAEAETDFDIYVSIVKANGDDYEEERLVLSPTSPVALSTQGDVAAHLLGDLAAFVEPLELSSHMLFAPTAPASHRRVNDGVDKWLLLHRTDVELNGDVCNKVGVSFEGFWKQPEECRAFAGDCLHEQLEDFADADEEALSQGRKGTSYLQFYGDFEEPDLSDGQQQYLAMTVEYNQASIVTLSLRADDIRFITQRSDGKINGVSVKTFEAQSQEGEMNVTVSNIGQIAAAFTVTVQGCSGEIMPLQAQSISLNAGQGTRLSFDLHSTVTLAGMYECMVIMYDAVGAVTDEFPVTFRTEAREDTQGAQAGDDANANDGVVFNGNDNLQIVLTCENLCTQWYDLICLVTNSCWRDIVVLLLVAVVLPLSTLLALGLCCGALWVCRAPIRSFACCCLQCALSGTVVGPLFVSGADRAMKRQQKQRKRQRQMKAQQRRMEEMYRMEMEEEMQQQMYASRWPMHRPEMPPYHS